MQKFKVLRHSIIGLKDSVVDLPDNSQTAQRIELGFIESYDAKVVSVIENKSVRQPRKPRKPKAAKQTANVNEETK